MRCSKCSDKAVFENPNYCKNHFIRYVDGKIFDTIYKFKLIKKKDKIIVAASGGKDSLTLLHTLNKKYKINALAIDEGIKDYREFTLKDLKKFCKEENIPLKVVSYKKEFGKDLDKMDFKDKNPCAVCGTFRRYLLNKYSQKFDVIATGHNLDDESQAILMNFLKPNMMTNFRIGPKTGHFKDKKFTPRVKPLYFLAEKEIRAYVLLKGIKISFGECPKASDSFRSKVRDQLNLLESKKPGAKKNIIDNFLRLQKKLFKPLKTKFNKCKKCGFVSISDICRACQLAAEI